LNFLIELILAMFAGIFKYHVGDATYYKIKMVLTFIGRVIGIIFLVYMIVLYLLFSEYEGTWFLYSLSYLHSIFNN